MRKARSLVVSVLCVFAAMHTTRASGAPQELTLSATPTNSTSASPRDEVALSVGAAHALHDPHGATAFMHAQARLGPWTSAVGLRMNDQPEAMATSLDTASLVYDAATWRVVAGAFGLSLGQRLTFAHGMPSRSQTPVAPLMSPGWNLSKRPPPTPLWGVAVGWGGLDPDSPGWRTTLFAARTVIEKKAPATDSALSRLAQGGWLDAGSLMGVASAFAWNARTQLGAIGVVDGGGGGASGIHFSAGSARVAAGAELSSTYGGAWAASAQATLMPWERFAARLSAHHVTANYDNVHSHPRGVPARRGRGPPAAQGAQMHLGLNLGPDTQFAAAAQLDHLLTPPKRGVAPWKLRLEEHLTHGLGAGIVLRGGGRLASRPHGWNTRATLGLSFEQPRWALGTRGAMDWGARAHGWRDVGVYVRAVRRERWQVHAQGGVRHAAKGVVEPFALVWLRARVSQRWSITTRYALQRAVHTLGAQVEVIL